jgi:hypothetical protein
MAAAPGPYPPADSGSVPPLTHPPNAIPVGQQLPPPGQYAPPQRGPITQPPRLTHIRLSLLPVQVRYRRPHKPVRSLRLRMLVLTVAIKAIVHIRTLATEDDIVARAERLRQAIDTQDLPAVAIERSAEAETAAADSAGGWKALLSLFHADSRDELVTL